jgi:lipoprotein-releasing system ATP-binding protein
VGPESGVRAHRVVDTSGGADYFAAPDVDRPPTVDSPRRAAPGAHVVVRGLTKVSTTAACIIDVLRGLDFEPAPGEMASVVGRVGRRQVDAAPGPRDARHATSGTITFDGVDVTQMRPARCASFRNTENRVRLPVPPPAARVHGLENAMMPGLIMRHAARGVRRARGAMLARLGLAQRLTHRPGELSAAEQQRVRCARAAACGRGCCSPDEPTGNLDTKTGREMHELFFEAQSPKLRDDDS